MPRNETTFGFVFQGDFVVQENEYDHETTTVTTNFLPRSGGGPPLKYYLTVNEEFDAVEVKEMVSSIGFRVDHSLMFNNFFCGVNIALGFALNERYDLLQGERFPNYYPLKNHFFETGVFVGHRFKK